MRVQTAMSAAVIFILLSAAMCGAAESDRVVGVWKSAEREKGRHVFIEIAGDTVNIDGKENDVVLEDRDGRVSVRIAGRDDIIAVIKVLDDATIEASLSSRKDGKLRLSRSSREEWTAADAPPVDRLLGLWRSEKGDAGEGAVTTLEIAGDSVTVNGTRTDAVLGTRKGLYTLVINGDDEGTIALNDNGSIAISFDFHLSSGGEKKAVTPSMLRGTFIRTTREELAAFASAADQTIRRYFGIWRSKEGINLPVGGTHFDFVEIGDGYVVINGARSAAKMEMTSDGLVATSDRGSTTRGKLLDDNTASFKYGSHFTGNEMVRSSPEEQEMIRNPNIAGFEGLWLPEDDAPTYRTLAIEENTMERDGVRQSFAVDNLMVRPNQLRLNLRRYDNLQTFLLCDLHYLGPDRIGVSDHGYMNIYRRASPEEFADVAKSLGEPFKGVQGYWRSADPVADGGIYATMLVERGVSEDGGARIFDRITHHFIDKRTFEPRYRFALITAEGVLGYRGADTSTPILLISQSSDRGYSSGIALKMIDANTLEANYGSGNRPVKMIRSTREEVDAIREAVRRMP